MSEFLRSESNVARKCVCPVVGVKALTVGIVSFLLWDGTVVDESLDCAFLPTVQEVHVPVLAVAVPLAICTNASVAQLVLEVCALVVENTNEELQLWEPYRKIIRASTSGSAIGSVPHVTNVVVLVSKLDAIPTAGHCEGNSDEVTVSFWKMQERPFLTRFIVVFSVTAALGHHPAFRAWVSIRVMRNHSK